MPDAGKCTCGWPLPLGVLAYALTDGDRELPNSCVRLVCPRCERGHQFFNAEDEASMVEFLKRFSKPKG